MIVREPSSLELRMLRMIADYQFGYGAGNCLFPDNETILVGISPSTRRIREVYSKDHGLITVLRANDYYYTLSILGAIRLLNCFPPPRLRVIINCSKPYCLEAKSLNKDCIIDVDERLRPGDEVIIVDKHDVIIGVGRLKLSPLEIKNGCNGEAVRVRRHVRGDYICLED